MSTSSRHVVSSDAELTTRYGRSVFDSGRDAALRGCYRLLGCPDSPEQESEWLAGYDSVASDDRGTLPISGPPQRLHGVLSDAERQSIQDCLDLLQEAQNLCDSAAQSLCAVPGFANEWSALSKPYDTVKAAWHKVASRRSSLIQTGGVQ